MRYFGFKKRSFGLKTIGWAGSTASALADLFKNGNQGIWLDPSDLKTMFQDVNGLVPVTKDGDPVALIKDKSGNNNHAKQPTASARPIYRTDGVLHWLQFDGVDDMFVLSKPINMDNGILAIACEATASRNNMIISGGSAGYLLIDGNYWSKSGFGISRSKVMHQRRQSVVAAINGDTVRYISSDGQSGEAISARKGLDSTRYLFRFNTTEDSPLQGRVYGFAMLANSVGDETIKEILTYLDKVSGISL